jgi:hypothetical protein
MISKLSGDAGPSQTLTYSSGPHQQNNFKSPPPYAKFAARIGAEEYSLAQKYVWTLLR